MAEKLEQSCEVLGCGRNVISFCFKCGCLLCSNHFTINITCETHYDPLPGTSHSIETSDDFPEMSTDLKLLSIRKDDSGEPINWTEMVEYRVEKGEPFKLFFKNKHTDKNYRSLTLKRPVVSLLTGEISKLNTAPPKIPQNKYEDLVSLTTGDTPVIKLCEHKNSYKSLPH